MMKRISIFLLTTAMCLLLAATVVFLYLAAHGSQNDKSSGTANQAYSETVKPSKDQKTNHLDEACYWSHPEIPFQQACEQFCDEMVMQAGGNDTKISYTVAFSDGWDNGAPEYSLVSGQKAVTCKIKVTLTSKTEREINEMGFYLIHNLEDNTLAAVGSYMIEDGLGFDSSNSEEDIEYIYTGNRDIFY